MIKHPLIEELLDILYGSDKDNELMHYGMPRRSGRYPYGSGENPYQHSGRNFIDRVTELRKQDYKFVDEKTGKLYTGDTAIAKSLNMTTSQFRTEIAIAKNEQKLYNLQTAKRLKEKEGLGWTEIGKKLGVPEGTVRSWFKEEEKSKLTEAKNTADFIRKQIDENGMIDVGSGTEREINISRERLNQALYLLEKEGYVIHKGGIPQATNPGKETHQKVICTPGTPSSAIYEYDKVHALNEGNYISRDNGKTFEKKFTYPSSLDSERLLVKFDEDGGTERDGLIQIRRGCEDLSLGESRYSQVRIMVDKTHYLKGMAIYGEDSDFPPGVDVIFNSNKPKSKGKLGALKEIKDDPDNPFGSTIKDADQGGQYWYEDSKTGERKLGLINKRSDQGDWEDWKNSVPSQFLSKQPLSLAKKQLELRKADKMDEFNDILSLNNPAVKKYYLEKFADGCDSAAVDLHAAAFPGQKYHVIIPFPEMKDNEIFAPNYKNGSKLALVRYPHGGTFEIPIVTVNNKQPEALKALGNDSQDAVGINSHVASILSGADFDGDTVMCIPLSDKIKIDSRDAFEDLKGFDPKFSYPERPGMKYMKDPVTGKDLTQNQMGSISNLITDMTIAGAPDDEMIRAVKHSMVVIDAGKHKLDYKKSEIDNNIPALKKKYQGAANAGASTLISRASGQASTEKRQGSYKINVPGTEWYDPSRPDGAKIYKLADDLYYPERVSYDKKSGNITYRTEDGKRFSFNIKNDTEREKYKPVERIDEQTGDLYFESADGSVKYRRKTRMEKTTKMEQTDDARSLISQHQSDIEKLYADYANYMKDLGNKARLELYFTENMKRDPRAAKLYSQEVSSLNAKLNDALKNAPKERAAQRMAAAALSEKLKQNPDMPKKDIKKASQQAITSAREKVGSVKRRERNIVITDKEWEAIQSGAVSNETLKKILANSDPDVLREKAMPKERTELNGAKQARIAAMAQSDYTIEQIATALGVSPSTVSKYLKGGKN